jgi:hypothetical protein
VKQNNQHNSTEGLLMTKDNIRKMDQPSKTTGVNLIACRTEQNENLRIVKISLEATIIARPGTIDPNLLLVMKTETEYGKSFFPGKHFRPSKAQYSDYTFKLT